MKENTASKKNSETSFRWTLRLPAFAATAGTYVASSLMINKISPNKAKRSSRLAKNLSRFCRIGHWLLTMSVDVDDSRQKVDPNKTYLIICNHLSYTDIIAISAAIPCVFVTSVEVQHSFFLGFMSSLGGSMFVERRNRNNIDGEIGQIAQAMRDGLNVCIFPEGTSSNGEGVLPFKRSLLKSALDAGVNVLPICIQYTEINGKVVPPEEKDKLYYYGDKDFFEHLKGVFSLKSFKAKLTILPEINVQQMQDRKEIADLAYAAIAKAYGGKIAETPTAERRPVNS